MDPDLDSALSISFLVKLCFPRSPSIPCSASNLFNPSLLHTYTQEDGIRPSRLFRLERVLVQSSRWCWTAAPHLSQPCSHISMAIVTKQPSHTSHVVHPQADVVVLVVDSRPAVLESPSTSSQTRDLAHLATSLSNTRMLVGGLVGASGWPTH